MGGHPPGYRRPAGIFEAVDNTRPHATRYPAGGTNSSYIAGQKGTPAAGILTSGMATASTPRVRQPLNPGPAAPANKAEICRGKKVVTRDTDQRKSELFNCLDRAVKASKNPRQETAIADSFFGAIIRNYAELVRFPLLISPLSSIAFHITSRSGEKPNQRLKAKAPCSTSIPIPSEA